MGASYDQSLARLTAHSVAHRGPSLAYTARRRRPRGWVLAGGSGTHATPKVAHPRHATLHTLRLPVRGTASFLAGWLQAEGLSARRAGGAGGGGSVPSVGAACLGGPLQAKQGKRDRQTTRLRQKIEARVFLSMCE